METSSRGQVGRGLWSCPRAPRYSQETQDMLRLMMQESRLTNFHQRRINDCLKKGTALPLACNPTSSVLSPQARTKTIKPGPTRLPGKPQRRSAESCRSGNSYARERFRPGPTRDLEKEKRRLQNILATGQEEPCAKFPKNVPADQSREVEEERKRDRHQEVLDEIEERRQFLADMTALGQGKHYHHLINTEISQKIHELKLIKEARGTKTKAAMASERKATSTEQSMKTQTQETQG
ncbi:UPF0193 protein EVG1 [Myripristis murdjan]|uniref:Uncharacterized protein n=1 Tax=Myripristis murdjan TaxID=586833 RepID=A0A668AJ86_9TELE|nr:UPF0193 protein EVG1 [Myripristis murdjan]